MSINLTAAKVKLDKQIAQRKREQQEQKQQQFFENEQEEQKQQPKEEINRAQLINQAKKEKEQKNKQFLNEITFLQDQNAQLFRGQEKKEFEDLLKQYKELKNSKNYPKIKQFKNKLLDFYVSQHTKIQDMMSQLEQSNSNNSQNKQVQKLQRELETVNREKDQNKLLLFEIKLQNIINNRKRQVLRKLEKNDQDIPSPRGFFQKTKYFFTGKMRSLSRDTSLENTKLQKDEIKNKQEQINRLKIQINDKEELIKNLQRNIQKLENEKQLNQHSSSKEKNQLKKFEENFNDVVVERNLLQEELANLEQQLKVERGQIMKQRNYFDQQMKQEVDKRAEINKDNERLRMRVQKFNDDLAYVNRQNEKKHSENEQIINQLSNELQDREVRITNLQREIQQLTKDLKVSKQETQQREKLINENQRDAQIAQLRDQIAQLNNQITDNQRENNRLVTQHRTSEQRIADLTNQIAQLQNDIADKDRRINLSNDERQGLDQRLADLSRDNQNLQLEFWRRRKVNLHTNKAMEEPFLNKFISVLVENNIDILNLTDEQIKNYFEHYKQYLAQNPEIQKQLQKLQDDYVSQNQQQPPPQNQQQPPPQNQQQPRVSPPKVQQPPVPNSNNKHLGIQKSQIVPNIDALLKPVDIQPTIKKIFENINKVQDQIYPDILIGHLRQYQAFQPVQNQTIQNLIQRLEQFGNKAITNNQTARLQSYNQVIDDLKKYLKSLGFEYKRR
ncbi:hypothetical protein ABPG74_005754 [Tetrahymena malaccensis]